MRAVGDAVARRVAAGHKSRAESLLKRASAALHPDRLPVEGPPEWRLLCGDISRRLSNFRDAFHALRPDAT